MNTLIKFLNSDYKIKQFDSYINRSKFLFLNRIKSVFYPMAKMNILFSVKPDWEKKIRPGFRFTSHKLDFNVLTPENIQNNDLVVPLTIDDLIDLNKNRQLIKNNLIPIPSLKSISICDDKYLFVQTLKKGGFEHAIPKVGNNLSYPYILKKKVADDGNDCYVISNEEQELNFKDLINNPDFFCQELIQGTNEYATHILFKSSKIISSINIKYSFPNDVPIKGKDEFICKKICNCPYLTLFTSILTYIGFEGLCCFNYKVIEGKVFIFEINPRFGGSLSPFFFSFITDIKHSLKVVSMPPPAGNDNYSRLYKAKAD
jgi:hypothetical protein